LSSSPIACVGDPVSMRSVKPLGSRYKHSGTTEFVILMFYTQDRRRTKSLKESNKLVSCLDFICLHHRVISYSTFLRFTKSEAEFRDVEKFSK